MLGPSSVASIKVCFDISIIITNFQMTENSIADKRSVGFDLCPVTTLRVNNFLGLQYNG